MSIDNAFKLKAGGAELSIELHQDTRTIIVFADGVRVYEQMFGTVGIAKSIAKFMGVKEILFIRTMRSRLNVDGSKRGYDYPRKKGEDRGTRKLMSERLSEVHSE
tara:strand:+ start:279 stop:593 length:315 start_codon:yes stop_codon:yes gene_type:complete